MHTTNKHDVQARTLSTSALWEATHNALTAQEWSRARALCERLSMRADNHDLLGSPASYGVPEALVGVLGDRIEAANRVAMR